MTFSAYPTCDYSGIDWLGEKPSHWRLTRLRFVSRLNPSKTEVSEVDPSTEVTFLPMDAIGENGSLALDQVRSIITVLTGYSYFREGDVTIAKITPCFENGKGAIMRGLEGGFGFGTTELIVARPITCQISSEFLNWIFRNSSFRALGEAAMYGAGGQKRVPDDFVRDFPTAIPPLDEQNYITAFLDRETAKIDTLVEEQRRLIALLKEKRQAIISHAVTHGLNPDAPTKDSGVEWLGEVPAHWRVAPLMRLTEPGRDIMYGIVLPGHDVGDGGVPIVKGGDVKPYRLKINLLNRTTQEIELPFARARLRERDIVYSIRGSIGDAEEVPSELEGANITQDVARISPKTGINPRWLLHTMRSKRIFVQLEQRSLGAAVRGINIFDLKRAMVPVPSPREQDEIASFLDAECSRIDELSATASQGIELLQERLAALISAAVTGKIDVRPSAVVLSFPVDRVRARRLIAAEIIDRSAHQATFGRTKLQKLLYLAEAHANVDELAGRYVRMPYGPLDQNMIDEIEAAAADTGFAVDDPGNRKMVRYRPIATRGRNRSELAEWLGDDRVAKLDKLITDFADLDTHAAEAVATLYAVWNDALIDGETPSDDSIVNGFLTAWNKKKAENFDRHELPHWLGWMRRHGLVPTGAGPKTGIGGLFV